MIRNICNFYKNLSYHILTHSIHHSRVSFPREHMGHILEYSGLYSVKGAPCLHNTQFNSKNQEAFDARKNVRQMPLDKRKNF